MRCAPGIVAGVMAVAHGAAAASGAEPPGGDGFNVVDRAVPWSRWQARVSIERLPATWPSTAIASSGTGLKLPGASLMGDYYFSASLTTRPSGFRATSGLLVGARRSTSSRLAVGVGYGLQTADRRGSLFEPVTLPASSDIPAEWATTPYVGVGYTGGSAKGSFSFSADLGVMALGAGAGIRPGRNQSGAASLDDVLRDMRLSPTLQLGVSYAF